MAEYLAAGYSQNRTSQIVEGVSLRTIQRWWADLPEFRWFVDERREALLADAAPLFDSTVIVAQRIHFGALTGEYNPGAPEVTLAREVLRETIWKHAKPRGTVQQPLDGADEGRYLPPGAA